MFKEKRGLMLFFNEYLKDRFGRSLYRIPVDLPLSCPHRITGGGKGCVFCPEDGARARHLHANLDLPAQVQKSINYVRGRYGNDVGLIAYFQSFTNTFAPVDVLEKYYSEVLSSADFDMIIISTRPDCLGEDILDFLEGLSKKYELWIELGVQSANDRTLELINRCHSFRSVEVAVDNLNKRGIKVAAHVILGLPGEVNEDFIYTAKKLSELAFSGIKIHNLLILKNTPLATLYQKQLEGNNSEYPVINPMNEYEYCTALFQFLKHIPEHWPLMRIVSDADKKDIIAPKWWMKKGQFLEYVKKLDKDPSSVVNGMPKILTSDGSYTLYHPEYRQHFHSLDGADSEAFGKFINPSGLMDMLLQNKSVSVLDIGFGLGGNALALIERAETLGKGELEVISLEKDRKTVKIASLLKNENKILDACAKNFEWHGIVSDLKVLVGDARDTIKSINKKFDAIFLDPFSSEVNPELWTFDFIKDCARLLKDDGVILTYSSAFPVTGAFVRAGLHIGNTIQEGRHRNGIIASFNKEKINYLLPEKKMNVIRYSTAGVPYRAFNSQWNSKDIFTYRKRLVRRLHKLGIPKWYKA